MFPRKFYYFHGPPAVDRGANSFNTIRDYSFPLTGAAQNNPSQFRLFCYLFSHGPNEIREIIFGIEFKSAFILDFVSLLLQKFFQGFFQLISRVIRANINPHSVATILLTCSTKVAVYPDSLSYQEKTFTRSPPKTCVSDKSIIAP